MGGKASIVVAACVATVAAAAFLLYQALILRMEQGDSYPAYSTHRADPMGMRLFHDALQQLPGITVERNTASILSLTQGKNTTLFFAGAVVGPDPPDILAALESFAATGGRMVITFRESGWAGLPEIPEPDTEEDEEAREKEGNTDIGPPQDEAATDTEEDSEEEVFKEVSSWDAEWQDISERWGFDYRHTSGEPMHTLVRAERQLDETTLPADLPWLNHTQFQDADERWTTVYAIDERPVVMTRTLGQGSIVLCADSFFLSNEALQEHDVSGMLSWLVGKNTRVLFDETHLGISDGEHLIRIAGELRLHGFIILLVTLAGLFVWRQTYTLVPRRNQAEEDDQLAEEQGRDASSALISLLRRSVGKAELLPTCFEEWRGSRPPGAVPQEETEAFSTVRAFSETAANPGQPEDIAKRYGAICAILRKARYRGRTEEGNHQKHE